MSPSARRVLPLVGLLLTNTAVADDVLRVTLRVDADGTVTLVSGTRGQGVAASADGPVQVVDADGARLASTALPHLQRQRDVPLPEGGGLVAEQPTTYVRVTVPWPTGASSLVVDGQRLTPSAPPRAAPPPAASDAEPVIDSGPTDRRLDLVFVSEGYTTDRRDAFDGHVDAVVDHLLEREPWGRYASLFSVWKVFTPSDDAGIDLTPAADDVDSPFQCYYGCGNLEDDRLVCCDSAAVNTFVAAHAPFADGVMVLVDSSKYGGSGASDFSVSYTGDDNALRVAAHELGHTLISLWDEYSYGYAQPSGEAFVSPNCVASDAALTWPGWKGTTVEGATLDRYPSCSFTDWDRPTPSQCLMNVLDHDWCPVCREAIIERIYTELGGQIVVDASPPVGERVVLSADDSLTFSVDALPPDDVAEITWSSGGTELGTGASFTLTGCDDVDGELTVTVRDTTPWVRDDDQGLLEGSVSWPVRTKCKGCGCDAGAPAAGTTAALLALLSLGARRRRSP